VRRRAQAITANWIGAAVVALLGLLPLALAAPALAAKLVGGHEQAAIRAAFAADAGHSRQLIVSIRASTVSSSWAVVKSVRPEGSGRTSSRSTPVKLLSTYYHRVKGSERTGRPPAPVKSDLAADFRVAVVYRGSGGESIRYKQAYRSVCAGAGGFTDQQDSTVSPMSWSVRYVVDLDHLVAAVQGSQGTMIVPSVAFDAGDSSLSAVQQLSRTAVDAGCASQPSTFQCTISYRLSGSGADGELTFPFGLGTEIGVPTGRSTVGQCDPNDYTLGPSLWDSGATTALVGRLQMIGGPLSPNPYAPVGVSWPNGSATQSLGFAASPCQGDAAACSDNFHWAGTVTLEPVPAN
jgi:hypothetical protein